MSSRNAICKCEKCGCTFSHRVWDGQGTVEWAEENITLCPDCYKEWKQAERAKRYNGLPVLEGSEKQIAWAEKIRKNVVDYVHDTYNITTPKVARYYNVYMYALSKITSAKLYIDTRNDVKDLLACDDFMKLAREGARLLYPDQAK